MQRLLVLALIGFVAQLIDGSLGMAYGVTSTSLLLVFGIAPAVASASVHMAEVVTTAASGISHWKFNNVDRTMVKRLMVPGSIGAFLGACFLSSLPGEIVKPYIASFLFLLGFYVLFRFLYSRPGKGSTQEGPPGKWTIPLGLFAGFADSTGGGGWGPLTTPILLSRKGMEARKVIGSVDTSEFAIAVSATLGFLISLGWQELNWTWVGVLMLGGIVAAPIAAWFVRIIPSYILGVLVGGLILITNAKTLLLCIPAIPVEWHIGVYGLLSLLWITCLVGAILRQRREKRKGA
ncbi:sulfite exporter TauE/SafE family protein [Salinithrix halophila]|uniref:Probable membrane transporter protein n=1 Tax=Salinithrix halophila TaxID=1485204 RepID=A0ABV8JID3_9BACL